MHNRHEKRRRIDCIKMGPLEEIMSLGTRNDQNNLMNESPDHDNIGMDPLI